MSKQFTILIWAILFPVIIFSQVDTGFVEIKGGKLFYRIWGSGEPMVFLNGGPGFASDGYESYAKELSKFRKVILFDQRGTGKSKLHDQNNVSIADMVLDLEALRKHLNIKKWDVFGHSFGGTYALYYIQKFESNINKLILSASPAYNSDSRKQFQKFLNIKYEDIFLLFQLENFKQLKADFEKDPIPKESIRKAKLCLKAKYYVYKEENILKTADWFANKVNSNENVSKLVWSSVRKKTIKTKKLKKFTNPVLIIHGFTDFINISNPMLNNEIFPNSVMKIIHESGHMIAVDQKEKYYTEIANFLNHKN